MSIKASSQPFSRTAKTSPKKSYVLAFAIASSSLLTGLAPITAQAAGLSDLFGNSQSDTQSKFLPVDEAFQVISSSTPTQTGTRLSINFDITPEHYVYKDQIKLTLPAGVTAAPFTFNQKPYSIDDPTFGKVLVFDQINMVATTTLISNNGTSINDAAIVIGWQGCAKAGLCYPPEKIKTTVNIAATSPQMRSSNASTDSAAASNLTDVTASTNDNETTSIEAGIANTTQSDDDQALIDDDVIDYDLIDDSTLEYDSLDGSTSTTTISGTDTNISGSATSSENVVGNTLVDGDPFGLASHPWLALVLLFLAGLGLALTPCVLPMLPIVANIVAREQNPTVKRGIILTTSYAIGVATAYGVLGAVIAVFGESLGIIGWLQNPIILISFAVVFVLLALSAY